MNYYSQNGQDIYLDNLFRQQKEGFFIEIGAFDGIKFSNTYFLEKHRKWKGICIEPNSSIYRFLEQNRKCTTLNVGVSNHETTLEYMKISGPREMLSGLTSQFDSKRTNRIQNEIRTKGGHYELEQIPCMSLNAIISQYTINSHVDYCSIDTEGSELSILEGIDFKKLSISVFSVENTYLDINIYTFMENNGYQHITRIGEDDFFISRRALEV